MVTVNRALSNISDIEVSGSFEVYIDNGKPEITIEAEENLIPYIITKSNGDRLKIRTKQNTNLRPNVPIKITVSASTLTDLDVTGSGKIVSNKPIITNEPIELSVSGSGLINATVHTPQVEASITGSGKINVAGATRQVDVDVTGSGSFYGEQLKAETAKVDVTGSGNVQVFADHTLDASITGSGDIRYKGRAAVNKNVTGSGAVSQLK